MATEMQHKRCGVFVAAVQKLVGALPGGGNAELLEMARKAPLLVELNAVNVSRKFFAEWADVLRDGVSQRFWGEGAAPYKPLFQEALDALVLLDACYP